MGCQDAKGAGQRGHIHLLHVGTIIKHLDGEGKGAQSPRMGGMESPGKSPSRGSSPARSSWQVQHAQVCPGQAVPAQGGSGAGLQRRTPGKGIGEAFPAPRGTAGRRHMETQSREWARGAGTAGSSLGRAWGALSCRPRCGPRCRAVPVPSASPRPAPGTAAGPAGADRPRPAPGLAGTAGLEGLQRPQAGPGDRAPGTGGQGPRSGPRSAR